jgi:hypothetical protein
MRRIVIKSEELITIDVRIVMQNDIQQGAVNLQAAAI